jgi:predicted ArsR family transcriptional regulator
MITVRQHVLNYLKKQHSASAAQIGRGLNLSAATVRHHLSIMLADGRIALIGVKRRGGRGRPVKYYGLSEKSLGDNFGLLSDALLEELLKKLSPAKRDKTIDAIARKLVIRFGENNLNVPMAKRLTTIVEKLNELHYQAHWEAGAQGPRLLFAHCPYAAIITNHPELCRIDLAMISVAMKNFVRQTSKVESGVTPFCIFVVDQT